MKVSINTDVLKKHNLTLGQFLVLLSGYFNLDYDKIQEELSDKELVEKNLFHDYPPILSDNTKNLIAKIIVESDDKLLSCPIKDFEDLAITLQQFFPEGNKPGKTYPWRGKAEEIALKLRTLVVKYDFSFTLEEAMAAVEEYVSSFTPPYTYMHTLRNFILCTKRDENGHYEMESQFVSIIENNREKSFDEESGGDIGDLEDALG